MAAFSLNAFRLFYFDPALSVYFEYAYCKNALRQKLEIPFNNRIFVALSSARVLIPRKNSLEVSTT